MRSRVSLLCCFTFFACEAKTGVELLDIPEPVGDQTVFAKRAIRAEVSFRDTRAPGDSVAERRSVYLALYPESIDGLEVYVNGTEADISSSAALPPSYFFVYNDNEYKNQALLVEFREAGSSFSMAIEPVIGQVSAPLESSIRASDSSFTLEWSGSSAKIPEVKVTTTHRTENTTSGCTVQYLPGTPQMTSVVVALNPEENELGATPPCELVASIEWSDQPEPDSPFGSFTLFRYATAALKTEVR